jgi:tRNA1(Val) A37 N6-methylase TrmN6
VTSKDNSLDHAAAADVDDSRNVTDDTLLGGAIPLRQPIASFGYRAGLEAPLLAAFALGEPRKAPRSIVDLAAGVGSVGLSAAFWSRAATVRFVEDEPWTVSLLRHNVAAGGLGGRAHVVEASVDKILDEPDASRSLPRGIADLVLTNPPWFDESRGASPTEERRRRARMLGPDGVKPFLAAGRQLLGKGGRLCIAFPAPSLSSLLADLRATGLEPKRLRFLHGRATAPADVVFVEALPAKPGGLRVLPPWFIRTASEAYTAEIDDILRGRWSPPGLPPRGQKDRTMREDDLRTRPGSLKRCSRFPGGVAKWLGNGLQNHHTWVRIPSSPPSMFEKRPFQGAFFVSGCTARGEVVDRYVCLSFAGATASRRRSRCPRLSRGSARDERRADGCVSALSQAAICGYYSAHHDVPLLRFSLGRSVFDFSCRDRRLR